MDEWNYFTAQLILQFICAHLPLNELNFELKSNSLKDGSRKSCFKAAEGATAAAADSMCFADVLIFISFSSWQGMCHVAVAPRIYCGMFYSKYGIVLVSLPIQLI